MSMLIPMTSLVLLVLPVPTPKKLWKNVEENNQVLRTTPVIVSTYSMVVDLLILLILISTILKMNLSLKKRIGVLGIFLTSLLCVNFLCLIKLLLRSHRAMVAGGVSLYFRVRLYQGNGGLRYVLIDPLKKRQNLFSLPSFPTINISAMQASQNANSLALGTFRASVDARPERPE
ncbi:hypothetical protein GQ44DRAFT_334708 [Phaeosphaeriaceae sp. PMI808]|nr:hypothetical protein GQ44DRAFT_334708 [Phaeosphaeriaceae sp. PMI808]